MRSVHLLHQRDQLHRAQLHQLADGGLDVLVLSADMMLLSHSALLENTVEGFALRVGVTSAVQNAEEDQGVRQNISLPILKDV